MSQMYDPPHPGEVLQDTVLREMTVTDFAKRLCVSRVALSRVVNGGAAVRAELAIRLAAALGGTAETWMHMQVAYDLWHAQNKKRPKIRPIARRQASRRGSDRCHISLPECRAGGGALRDVDLDDGA